MKDSDAGFGFVVGNIPSEPHTLYKPGKHNTGPGAIQAHLKFWAGRISQGFSNGFRNLHLGDGIKP